MSDLSWDPVPEEPTEASPAAEHTAEADGADAPARAEPIRPAPVPASAAVAGGGGRSRLLAAACAVLLVVAVVLGGIAAAQTGALSSERGRRDDIENLAGRFATALLSYDYKDLDASRAAVRSFSTEKFQKEYERAYGSLEVLLTQTEAISQGTVTEVYVGDSDDDTAVVIVVADAVSKTKAGTRRTLASYIQLELVKVGDDWLVNGVTNLNFGQGVGASTTTTAPAAPKATTKK